MAIFFYILFTLLALGIMALAAFLAYRRGFFKSVVKCGIAVLSLALAILITKLFSSALQTSFAALTDTVLNIIGTQGSFEELISSSRSFEILLSALPVAIVAPLVFVAVFFILKFIFDIVFYIIGKTVIKDRVVIDFKYSKYVSCALGCVIAFLCIYTALVPINGFVSIGANIYEVVKTVSDDGTPKALDGFVDGLNKNPVKVVTYATGGRAIFNTLTTFEIEGETYSIGRELTGLSVVASRAVSLSRTDAANWGKDQAKALREIPDALKDTKILTTIVSDILRVASSAWSEGEKFIGINAPANNNVIINDMIEVFSTSDADNITDDLTTICDVMAVFCDHRAMHALLGGSKVSSEEILLLIGSDRLLADTFLVLAENDRMSVMINSFTEFGLTTVASALSVPTDEALQMRIYSELASKLKKVYTYEGEKLENEAVKAFKAVFNRNGLAFSEAEIKTIALAFISDTSADTDITSDHVRNYFEGVAAVHASGQSNAEEILNRINAEIGSEAAAALFGTDSDIRLASVTNRKELLDAIKSKEALDILLSLAPSNTVISKDITMETVEERVDVSGADRAEIEELGNSLGNSAKDFAAVAISMSSMGSNISGNELMRRIDIDAMCRAFETIGDNKYIGEVSTDILDAFLKAKAGFTMSIRDIIDNSDDSNVGDATISTVLRGLHDTLILMDTMDSSGKNHDEKVREVEDFIKNIDSAHAKSISKAMNAEMVESFGVPEERSDAVSDMLTVMFEELGKQNDESGREEAEAVKYLFDVAMSAKGAQGELFGEKGKIEDIDRFVETIKNSEVAANTVSSTTTDDYGEEVKNPLGIAEKLTSEDEEKLLDAIEASANKEGTTDAQRKTLHDLANMFGAEWTA